MDLDQLLDLIIKAQRSSMKSGAAKKSWVTAQMTDEDPALTLSATIDWVLMIVKDPAVHKLFVKTGRSCADRLCRGKNPG